MTQAAARRIDEDTPVLKAKPRPRLRIVKPELGQDPVREFLAEMIEAAGGGGSLYIGRIYKCYQVMRHEHRWPDLTIKKLVRELTRLGCRRVQVDLRCRSREHLEQFYRGAQRPTFFVFPSEV